MRRVWKMLRIPLGVLLALGVGFWVAMRFTPRPAVSVIRLLFDHGAATASAALEKHLPANLVARTDLVYDPASPDGRLDAYHPPPPLGASPLTTVVWVHGGAFVSGRKEDVGNYCRVLAGRGFLVVAVDYTIAPEARYPTPAHQVNAALRWLLRNPENLPLDPRKIFLAGDSAGAHIAAQLAHAHTAPDYAAGLGLEPALAREQLAGVLLYCGVYSADNLKLDGPFGVFLKTALWSYFGTKHFLDDPRIGQFSLPRHLTKDFPPAFVTGGNADPLLPQSRLLVDTLKEKGAPVSELFFPDDHEPALGHEYQFDLDTEAGRLALERTVLFLTRP